MAITSTEELLKKLVAYPTVSVDKKTNARAINYIARFLQKRNMTVKKYDCNGYKGLVATTRTDNNSPTIMLYAHLDVIPANSKLWKLQKRDGKYFGRGVLDMKYALAVYMKLVDELQSDLPDYDFGIMIVSDEENSGGHSAYHLLEKGHIPKVCIMPDGGENWQIEVYAKGVWHFQIETWGKSSHGSRPWQGKNAISQMIAILHEIETLFMYGQRPDTITLNIGYIKGGGAVNQVPDYAIAGLDIRYLTDEECSAIKTKVQSICKRRDAELTSIEDITIAYTDLSNHYVQLFISSARNAIGITLKPSKSHGASDARYFSHVNVPCIISSPIGGDRHSNNEWIDCKSVEQFKYILKDYLQTVAKCS